MDDINPIIDQYVLRPGHPYLSGASTLTALVGPFGVPYHMQGLALQTCVNRYISAPSPWRASTITHSTKTLSTTGQYAIGAAPTSGIYTGVEDSCS